MTYEYKGITGKHHVTCSNVVVFIDCIHKGLSIYYPFVLVQISIPGQKSKRAVIYE